MGKRRQWFAVCLLAVFLPALLISSLHHHEAETADTVDCIQCAHHLPHPGHLSNAASGMQECVLCHFIGLPFLLSLVLALTPLHRSISLERADRADGIASTHPHSRHSRAPPAPASCISF